MKNTILIFGTLSASILILFQIQKWSLFIIPGNANLLHSVSAAILLLIGLLAGRYLYIRSENKKRELKRSILSDQELRVLKYIAQGLSNKEIANHLFIAESTVKTHVSSILSKLDARRRTEAIKIGQELNII